jgi:hypothetical protein
VRAIFFAFRQNSSTFALMIRVDLVSRSCAPSHRRDTFLLWRRAAPRGGLFRARRFRFSDSGQTPRPIPAQAPAPDRNKRRVCPPTARALSPTRKSVPPPQQGGQQPPSTRPRDFLIVDVTSLPAPACPSVGP